jgi:hypothetical protein
MESDVIQWGRKERKNDFEGLDGAIQVLIVDGILIVPHSGSWPCYFVTDKENTVASGRWPRGRLNRVAHGGSGPGFNRRLLSESVAHEIKGERLVDSNYAALTVRCVVIHVALVRVTLAPGAFVRDDVFRFSKIGRPDV